MCTGRTTTVLYFFYTQNREIRQQLTVKLHSSVYTSKLSTIIDKAILKTKKAIHEKPKKKLLLLGDSYRVVQARAMI